MIKMQINSKHNNSRSCVFSVPIVCLAANRVICRVGNSILWMGQWVQKVKWPMRDPTASARQRLCLVGTLTKHICMIPRAVQNLTYFHFELHITVQGGQNGRSYSVPT